ncbi:MAG TPA: helix-turn-helix domain-containing protein [Rugosimonospora sp.]|nr:helix-turn-helix domain-containing protein [Rugosimonospora sp.]
MSAAEARRLRVDEGPSIAAIQARLGVTKHTLTQWLRGIPAPGWTRRPNAKDALRARALELRGAGWSVNDIALELGVATSTAWLWVKHLPLDADSERARAKAAHAKLMTDARWERQRQARDRRREQVITEARTRIGRLSGREVLLVGAVAYWCEGTKSKPWRPNEEHVTFTNSDPVLIEVFLRCVELLGRPREGLGYRVAIHESADATAATRWWAEGLRLPLERFLRPTLKRHEPATLRRNVGDDSHGCLVVTVPRSRELYWQIQGTVAALNDG